jgi:hypothetical protein
MMRKQRLFLASLLTGYLASVFPSMSDEIVAVEQGWSPADKTAWYTTTQGSRLLPLSWLRALEQPESEKPFLAPEYMAAFGYLPGPDASDLPIGFTIDAQDDSRLSITKLRWKQGQSSREPWAGMTCSACHSNEITYNGKRLRVEGAPTLADFQSFREALNRALDQTWLDDQKFARFAKKVLGDDNQDSDKLRGELAKLVDFETKLGLANATPLRYGFARLDAIGNIFNKVATVVNAPKQTFHASDAPVSYPFLWNIPQLSAVQWNASAPNKPVVGGVNLGALARNSGEVIGVFGDVHIELYLKSWLPPGPPGYMSSINMVNLDKLEQLVRRLKPPAWPSVFPAIDENKRVAGQRLFAERCARCHSHLDREDLAKPVPVANTLLKGPDRIGTDPWMACNAYANSARTGLMLGTPTGYLVLPGEKLLLSTAPEFDLLKTAVIGSIVGYAGRYKELVKEVAAKALKELFDRKSTPHIGLMPEIKLSNLIPEIDLTTVAPDKKAQLNQCLTDDSPILGYKFRPLTGIWATAPYLHNGSVPTLYDLLLPPSERPKSFYVGTREFDPVKVGFKTEQSAENSFLFRVLDDQGNQIQGNLNSGHDYNNAGLSEGDREALVEYMKGL